MYLLHHQRRSNHFRDLQNPGGKTVREENRLRILERDRLGGVFARFSWQGILAGVVLALAIHLMLSLLGAGIGAATVDPRSEQNPAAGLGVGSAVWLGLTTIIAMFVGGWVAARTSAAFRSGDGMLHGAVVWGATTLVALYFLTSTIGGLISGTTGLISTAVSGGAEVASQSPQISESIRQELAKRGIDINSILGGAQDPATQQQAGQAARETGAKVATGVSAAGLGGFFAMAIGLVAAILGGAVGSRGTRRDIHTDVTPTERAA
jgi:hypothetical protein